MDKTTGPTKTLPEQRGMDPFKSPGELIREEMENVRLDTKGSSEDPLGAHCRPSTKSSRGNERLHPRWLWIYRAHSGSRASRWLHMEADYRLGLLGVKADDVSRRARLYEVAPVKDMERRGWIAKTNTAEELEQQLLDFYGVDSLDTAPEITASFVKRRQKNR